MEVESLARARVLGPHCQCLGELKCLSEKGQAPKDRRVSVQLRGKDVKVPLWVAYNSGFKQKASSMLPRYQVDTATRRGGRPGLLRSHVRWLSPPVPNHSGRWGGCPCPCTWVSRCVIPKSLYLTFECFVKSLETGVDFVGGLLKEFEEMFQDVGVNKDMQRLWRSLWHCFDWSTLAQHRHMFSNPVFDCAFPKLD